jgi:heme-degrading monooxygenase HmoA
MRQESNMYAVIFRARTRELDESYARTAASLRALALESFGCLEFVSVSEGPDEISISYWLDEASIRAWKEHAEHRLAQAMGRDKWYERYCVQVVEVMREYAFPE